MPSNQDDKSKGMKGMGEAGNQQSAGQGKSRRGQGNQQNSDLASGPGDNSRGQGRQSGNLNQNQQSANKRGNPQNAGQGSQSGRTQLDQDELDSDASLQR